MSRGRGLAGSGGSGGTGENGNSFGMTGNVGDSGSEGPPERDRRVDLPDAGQWFLLGYGPLRSPSPSIQARFVQVYTRRHAVSYDPLLGVCHPAYS